MSRPTIRIHPRVREALNACGQPWTVENGGRHFKLRIAGRLVSILPKGTMHDRGRETMNTIKRIERFTAR